MMIIEQLWHNNKWYNTPVITPQVVLDYKQEEEKERM